MAGPGARWYELCNDSICSCEKQGPPPSAPQAAASSAVATSTVPVQPVGRGVGVGGRELLATKKDASAKQLAQVSAVGAGGAGERRRAAAVPQTWAGGRLFASTPSPRLICSICTGQEAGQKRTSAARPLVSAIRW